MDKKKLKELKKSSNSLKPEFNLGKNGLTQSFLNTVDNYLKAHSIVKVKVSAAEDKTASNFFADSCAKELDAILLEKKGFTFTIYKEFE